MRIFFIVLLFQSLSIADTIKVGSVDQYLGFVKKDAILKILSCTTSFPDKNIEIIDFPKARVEKNFLSKILDAYYPVSSLDNSISAGLYPLYVDEFLLISVKGVNEKKEKYIGVIGDHLSYIQKFLPEATKLYKVQNIDALFGGLERKRVTSIAVRRSQLYKDFKLKDYEVKSLYFEEMGIRINDSFARKTKSSFEVLSKKFKQCLANFDFRLEVDQKKEIFNYLKIELDQVFKFLPYDENLFNIENISAKEKLWYEESAKRQQLADSTLNNAVATFLTESFKKYDFVTEAFIFNSKGGLVASIEETTDFDQSDEEKFSILKGNIVFKEEHIQNIYFDTSTGKFQLAISYPLKDNKGKFAGGLFLAADINKLLLHFGIK